MSKSVFLSYAREDDEAFVRKLYGDLKQAGFTVWYDRESLLARGLAFHQEIKDAIRTEADRVVYIGGPKAALSQYVREEWQFALECDHVVVTPILRLGDYDQIPGELRLLHCEDFRDDSKYTHALDRLIRSLNQPNPKLGGLFAVPSLPPHFLGRPELMRRVRDALLVDLQKPQVITSADAKVGMQGMGGIGKSVLAAALARNREVRQSYPDGIVWIACGQHLSDDDLLKRQRDLARHLGGNDQFSSLAQGAGVLRDVLAAKAVMLVLDDVWHAADAKAFDVLGPRCRMLVTTRDSGILHTLNGELVPVSLFTEREAMQLLADAVNIAPDDLPPEAHEVVHECGKLPLALALSGGMAKAGHVWQDIVEALREADLEWPEDRTGANEQHRTIWAAMKVSYDVLPHNEKSRFAELAVFSTDTTVPETAVQTLWEYTGRVNARNCSKLLINLAERSLIQLDQKNGAGGKITRRFSLHDLLHDFAVRIAGDHRSVHQNLLDAYRKKCSNGWHSGPDDGYFFQNLCHHLSEAAGNWDEVVELLCDLRFVESRCKIGQVFELIANYRLAKENIPEAQDDLKKERARQAEAQRWTTEIIAYAKAWSNRRDRKVRNESVNEPEPSLPTPPATCRMWTDEEIKAECDRIIISPTRRDRLEAFATFVTSQCYPLINHGSWSGFIFQHAFNSAPVGPVNNAAALLIPAVNDPHLLRRWPADSPYNPKPALLRILEGHKGTIKSLSITPDGQRAVSGSESSFREEDKSLRVWDLESGECLRILEGHSSVISCVNITPDGRLAVSSSWDDTLRVWDLESGECLHALKGRSYIDSLSVTPDGRRAVSGNRDNTLQVWDLESGQCLQTLEGHSRWYPSDGDLISSVSITPDGRCAVSGSWDSTLRLWDLESGQCLRTFGDNRNGILNVSMTPDGLRALSCNADNTLRLWDLTSGESLCTLEGHNRAIISVSMTPDGCRAISGSRDRTLRVWDLESGQCLRILEGHSNYINGVSITPDGHRVVSGGEDKALMVWNPKSGESLQKSKCHSDSIESVGMTLDGHYAVSGSSDGTLQVWNVENGRRLHILEGNDGPFGNMIESVSVTPDGRFVVSGGWGYDLQIWNLENGQCLNSFRDPNDVVHSVIESVNIANDGHHAISGGLDRTVRVWDLKNGQCLRKLEGHHDIVMSVGITPDGQRAVSGSRDKTVRVWDLGSGKCLRIIKGHSDCINSVSVTRDGRRVVSGSDDKTVRVWDLESGVCLRKLEGHGGEVRSVSVKPNGHSLISGSDDKTVRLWDLESGICLAVFRADSSIRSVAASLNRAAIGTNSGSMIFIDVHGVEINPALELDASDKSYEILLRRNLEFSGKQKGKDHEETLAHLTALSVHLQKMGKSAEAREFAHERNAIVARISERK
jgi:WD40 repeat protein